MMKPSEILRWAVALAFGGLGVWMLAMAGWNLATSDREAWLEGVVWLMFAAVCASVPLLISYFALRRDYYRVITIFAVLLGAVIFCVLLSLPSSLGWIDWIIRHERENRWLFVVSLPASLLFLFGPFYVARWSVNFCLRMTDRYLPQISPFAKRPDRGALPR